MQRKLLIAVTGDMASRSGLRFVSEFCARRQDMGATLFHVTSNPETAWSENGTPSLTADAARQAAAVRRKGLKVLGEAHDFLVRQGFPEEGLDIKLQPRRSGSAFKDIVHEGLAGSYDAVVLGHGGYTLFDAVLRGSVSKALLDLPWGAPLWICRRPGHGRRNVLVCVDGSDQSLRAADHVGFMLAAQPDHEVHVLHVHDPAKVEPLEYEDVMAQARGVLAENGVGPERVTELVRRGSNPLRVIAGEVARGGYAAVAVGSTGADRPPWQRLFMGSVSLALFKALDETALWVCH